MPSSFSDSDSSSSSASSVAASPSAVAPKLSLSPQAAAQASSALSQLSKEDLKARRARIVAAVEAATQGGEQDSAYERGLVRGARRDKDSSSYHGRSNQRNYSRKARFDDDDYEEREERKDRGGRFARHDDRRDRRDRRDSFERRDRHGERDHYEHYDRFDRHDSHERHDRHWENERRDLFERHERHDNHDSFKGRAERDGFKGRSYGEHGGAERGARGERRGGERRGERFAEGKRNQGRFAAQERAQERQGVARTVTDVHKVFASTVPVGQMVPLPVVEISDKGVMVDGAEFGKLFIPRSQVAQELHLGDTLRVFIYQHSGRFLATAKRPYFELGMTGRLRVTSIEHDTVYLDLGIPKELVLPRSEQRRQFAVGDEALVLIAIDELGRLYASQCFNRFIRDTATPDEFVSQQEVKVVAIAHTNLGYRAIVDDRVYGLIYESEQHGELQIGKRYDGYITAVRPDGRLDVSLQISGQKGTEQAAADVLQALFYSQGHLHFNDRSSPQEIEDYLHISKKRFKSAIGYLYKNRLIVITDHGIDLTDQGRAYQQERMQAQSNKSVAVPTDLAATATAEDEGAGAVNAAATDGADSADSADAGADVEENAAVATADAR